MKLGEKIRCLRYAEGVLRGLGREMTQSEIARAAESELGRKLSQSYLSQIENGRRPHLTKTTRHLLAKFFKVHPGFLVDDPEGFHTHILSNLPIGKSRLDDWLLDGSRRFRRDPELSSALERLSSSGEARRAFMLLTSIVETPGLVARLLHVLRPGGRQQNMRAAASPSLRGLASPSGSARTLTHKEGD